MHVSAITVMERMRGFALLLERDALERRADVEVTRQDYLDSLGVVIPVDATVALYAAELSVLLPQPPSSTKRSHRVLAVVYKL
jgi:hypothetical protein